jgi:hypothetical protein
MGNISTSAELKEAIQQQEAERSVHLQEMRSNFFHFKESFKPANLIKSAMNQFGSSPYLFNNILNISLGLVAGYLFKNALFRSKSKNMSGKLLGLILQLGITNLVVYAPKAIQSFVKEVFSNNDEEIKSD